MNFEGRGISTPSFEIHLAAGSFSPKRNPKIVQSRDNDKEKNCLYNWDGLVSIGTELYFLKLTYISQQVIHTIRYFFYEELS